MLTLGLLYLIIIAAGVYAHFWVLMQLLEVSGDPNFLDIFFRQGPNIRYSLFADGLMVLSDVLVAWLFYRLMKEVNAMASLWGALFRWIQSGILAWGLYRLTALLPILRRNGQPQSQEEALVLEEGIVHLLEAHSDLYIVSGVFFGLSCLVLGYLFVKSNFMPNYLGVLLSMAGLTYVADGLVNYALPSYADISETAVAVAALIAEIYLCLWLLVKGLRGLMKSPA